MDAPAQRILVVEDDPALGAQIVAELERAGYQVEWDRRGAPLPADAGRGLALVILDLMLPGVHGLDLLKQLRAHSDVPVLVLSARNETRDKVRALQLGADYVEVDTRTTADGYLVVIHDSTVDRTTNGTGPVADYTLEEIQALDAGSWFRPRFAGLQVPTFAAVAALVRSYNRSIYLDWKAATRRSRPGRWPATGAPMCKPGGVIFRRDAAPAFARASSGAPPRTACSRRDTRWRVPIRTAWVACLTGQVRPAPCRSGPSCRCDPGRHPRHRDIASDQG